MADIGDSPAGEKNYSVRFHNKLPLCFILTVLMGNQFWLVTMVTMIVKNDRMFFMKTSGWKKKRPAGQKRPTGPFLEKRPVGRKNVRPDVF